MSTLSSVDIGIRNDALIKEYRETGNEDTRETFFKENTRLVRYLARQFDNIGDSIDERISIGYMGLLKAFNTYKLDAGVKFATYASRVINNEFLMYYRRLRKHFGRLVDIEEPLNVDQDGATRTLLDIIKSEEKGFEDYGNNEIIQQALENLRSDVSDQTYSVFEECFIKGRLQHEVAEELRISQSYISRLVKKATHTLHKIGQKLMNEPKGLKDMGYKLTVNTSKGEIPSAEANGMIAYLLNNTGASNATISRFLGVVPPQVSAVKRRIDGGTLYEHIHPSRYGFNMDDLFDEQVETVKEDKDKMDVKLSATESRAGLNKAISDAVAKDLHVASKLSESTSIPEALATRKSVEAIEEFASKMAEERHARRERDQKLTESKETVFHDPEFEEYEKATVHASCDGISNMPYTPYPKQTVSDATLSTKGTGHALAEMVGVLLRALDPEKTYKLHLVYEELNREN